MESGFPNSQNDFKVERDLLPQEVSEPAITGVMRGPSTTDSGCVAMPADNV